MSAAAPDSGSRDAPGSGRGADAGGRGADTGGRSSERLAELVALSRRYGSDPAWVLAGGGNTSYKNESTLWVKASGSSLGTIGVEGFCAIDRARLDAIWDRKYPDNADEREAAALADLMGSRAQGETKRPSVETLMHGFFPQAFVVHTHPSLVNGLTCGRGGEQAFGELFGDEAIWVPLVDPGYILAKTVRQAFEAFRARQGRSPALMFMQNHGLLVAGETPEEIDSISSSVVARLASRVSRRPDRRSEAVDAASLAEMMRSIASLAGPGAFVAHRADADILAFARDAAGFAPLASAFSPDHIVYAGHEFALAEGAEDVARSWSDYFVRNGGPPRIVLARGLGAVSVERTQAAAASALALFLDACAVAVYAESFGGALHMPPKMVQFILNWEVERYRAKTSIGSTGG